MGDMEEHVCQSCGMPMGPEDYPEGSEKGDFCQFCMVHEEFVSDREEVKSKMADAIQEQTGKSRAESLNLAEEKMSALKRWQ
jgi:Putative zinc ribbon domain